MRARRILLVAVCQTVILGCGSSDRAEVSFKEFATKRMESFNTQEAKIVQAEIVGRETEASKWKKLLLRIDQPESAEVEVKQTDSSTYSHVAELKFQLNAAGGPDCNTKEEAEATNAEQGVLLPNQVSFRFTFQDEKWILASGNPPELFNTHPHQGPSIRYRIPSAREYVYGFFSSDSEQ